MFRSESRNVALLRIKKPDLKKSKPMNPKIFRWVPRILSIITILFLLMFSFDVFESDASPGKQLFGFLIHNIPVWILIAALVVAWKHELAGGIMFIVLFIALGIFWRSFTGNPSSLIVGIPILLTGIIFLINGIMISKHEQ
jgi:hypothetical protein